MRVSLTTPNIRFGSILTNRTSANAHLYEPLINADADFRKFSTCSTRIFREPQILLGVLRAIKPQNIHIIGSSDGSEPNAWAIASKEILAPADAAKVKIWAIDREPSLIELSRTHKIVCTDNEKTDPNTLIACPDHPLRGDGWDRYLQETTQPREFDTVVAKHPWLRFLVTDPVNNIGIGNGMKWYEVKRDGLPPIKYEHASFHDYMKSSSNGKNTPRNQGPTAYVVSNMLSYITEQGPQHFTNAIKTIIDKKRSGNSIYIVFGQAEVNNMLQYPLLMKSLKDLGLEPIPADTFRSKGVPQQSASSIEFRVWKLTK